MARVAKLKAVPEFSFDRVPPHELEKWWPLVSEGLRVVRLRVRPTWVIEDVYVALRRGQAFLYVSSCHGKDYAGFCVVSPSQDPFNWERYLVIWAVYARLPGAVDHCIQELRHEAQAHGFSSLVFQSPRPGWLRRMQKHGFRTKDVTYEMRLG